MPLSLHLLLPTPVGHAYYDLFYLLGFGVAGGLLIVEAIRRQYAWRPWLVLMGGVQLLLILGTKLIAGSAADWQYLLTRGIWTGPDHRSILGGLFGLVLGVAVLRRWLGFDRRAYDALALPLLVGLAVQGIGCLLTGCCFGTTSPSLPFGVSYAPGTLPFLVHVSRGLLAADAARSLPVHPAQLYQILLCLGMAAGLLVTRKQQWPAGWRFTLVLLLYVLGRFGLEFWRDAAGDVVGSGLWHHLKPMQWGLLLAVLPLVGWLVYQKKARVAAEMPTSLQSWQPLLGVAALLLLTAVLGPQWLVWSERWVVQALLLVVLVLEANYLRQLRRRTYPAAKLATLLGCLAMLTMSQAPAPEKSETSDPQRRYTTFSVGGLGGASQQFYDYPYGCSGQGRDVGTYRQTYQAATLGIARMIPTRKTGTFTFGLEATLGRTRFRPDQAVVSASAYDPIPEFTLGGAKTLYAITPYIAGAGSRFVRYGLGMHIGHVAYDYAYDPGKLTQFYPKAMVDVGYLPYGYLHVGIGQEAALGNGTMTFGVGSGFGKNEPVLTAGVAVANSEANFKILDYGTVSFVPYLNGHFKLGQQFTISPYLASNFQHVSQFRLQVHYRLPGAQK